MESLFQRLDYRSIIRHIFSSQAKNGYGRASQLAVALGVHNTFVSQVLRGSKSLTPEQAIETARFLNLNELEADYFILLVQYDRAGSKAYKTHLRKKIDKLRETSEQLVNRLDHVAKLNEEQSAIFYSDWIYSAIRLSTLIKDQNTIERLASSLNLPVAKVATAVDFLVGAGLLKKSNGLLSIGPLSTHLPATSPWIKSHHANWRQKALADVSLSDRDSLHYSAPMTLSLADMKRIRELLVKTLSEIDQIVEPSPSDELVCLNLDLFKIR